MTTPRTELEAMSDEALAVKLKQSCYCANLIDAIKGHDYQCPPCQAARRLRERAWIPVSERLPESGGHWYEVAYDDKNGGSIGIALLRGDRTGFVFASDIHSLVPVYAWRTRQPLPPPPREEEGI